VRAAMRKLGLKRWEIMDDGDDCLLIVEARDEHLLNQLSATFLTFGQELKIENRAIELEDVVFCQCKYTDVGGVPRMIRPWRKVLSSSACGTAHWLEPKHLRGLLNAVGRCEYALNKGVPVLEEFARALIRLGDGTIPKFFSLMDEGVGWRFAQEAKTFNVDALLSVDLTASFIGPRDRINFQRTWGMTPQQQVDIERAIQGWTFDSFEPHLLPAEHVPHTAWFSARPTDQFIPMFGNCPIVSC